MVVKNCNINDTNTIFDMYNDAVDYQKQKLCVHWPDFDKKMVLKEILDNKHFKIMVDNYIVCIWCITFNDKLIWGSKENFHSVYIHRIATNKNFRGNNYVKNIIEWARNYKEFRNKKFLRLDTVGLNKKLIDHYTKNGFIFLGTTQLGVSKQLPDHYQNASVSLFEMKL